MSRRFRIRAVVEGDGEIEAVPALLGKIARECYGRVIYDGDDDCPVTLARRFPQVPSVQLAVANREFEAWFLHSVDDWFGVPVPANAETVRDAKGDFRKITIQTPEVNAYGPTSDQAVYARRLNPHRLQERSRSFQRLVKAVGELLAHPPENP